MTQTEALKLALEALEECRRDPRLKYEHSTYDKAITAIKEALAQPEQAPVAYRCIVVDVDYSMDTAAILIQDTRDYEFNDGQYWLSTTPPQPEQEPVVFLSEWSDWRNMVVQNLMRHGNVDKDFARRLAHYYQDMTPQRKPLTEAQAAETWPFVWRDHEATRNMSIVRAIEAAHGIKE